MKHKKQSSDKKKSSRKKKNVRTNDNDDVMEDERFIAASTRPQFKKSGRTKGGTLLVDNNNYGDNEKIELDDRFAAVLTDPRFQVGGDLKSDKYGRKIKKKGEKNNNTSAESDLTSFYKIKKSKDHDNSEDDNDDDNDDLDGNKLPLLEKKSDDDEDDDSRSRSSSSSSSDGKEEKDDEDEEEDVNDPESRIAYLTALSRGEISASSSSDDDDTSDDDDSSVDSSDSDESEDSIYGKAGILDPTNKATEEEQIDVTFELSPYLAVCNLDWTNVRAVDILVVLSSFTSPGSVKCVKVFPSDYGLEQLEREKVMGPSSIWKKDSSKHDSNKNCKKYESDSDEEDNHVGQHSDESSENKNDDDENVSLSDEETDILDEYKNFPREEYDENCETDFDPEKLRAYEASKLKYYFAVAEFANSESADIAYKEVDGMEIGHSSASFDLRSIPPTKLMEVVEGRTVRDEATNIPSNYSPPDFVVSALQQTAVKCTWDEGDAERQNALTQYGIGNQAWAAMTEGDDLKAYLASDVSSDDESDGSVSKETKGSRLRAMLGLGSDDDNSGNENDDNSSQSDEDSTDGGTKEVAYFSGKSELVQKIRLKIESKKAGAEETKELSPWEKYQLKRKEKRKERRKEAKERQNAFKQSKTDNDNRESAIINEEEDDFLVAVKDKTKKTPKKTNEINSQEQRQTISSKEELKLLVSGTNG